MENLPQSPPHAKFQPLNREIADPVTHDNYNKALTFCFNVAVNPPNHHLMPMLDADEINVIASRLHESGLADRSLPVRRFITALCMESDMYNKGSRYMFDLLKVGEYLVVPRSAEARIRQALVRHTSRNPMRNISLRAMPNNPKLMILTRNL